MEEGETVVLMGGEPRAFVQKLAVPRKILNTTTIENHGDDENK